MRSKRWEFSNATKKAATARAGGRCEAAGYPYSSGPESRCTVTTGLQHDHFPKPAIDEGSDTLENCVVICAAHHAWKSAHYDVPLIAKSKRIQRANGSVEGRRKKRKIAGRSTFPAQSRPMQSRNDLRRRPKKDTTT